MACAEGDLIDAKPVEFQIRTPIADDIVKRQIKHSRSLGLPEMDGAERSRINIVANGPGARGVRFEGPTLAINGAISLFSRDNPPTMWAACDPQALVADFLTDPSPKTTFLVASKCHLSVFERLEGYDVRLWHINDQPIPGVRAVPCAVSVTLCAMILMHRLGYRRLDIWGWNCAFADDGSHHAGPSGEAKWDRIEVDVGGKVFNTSTSWAAEAQDALNIIAVLEWCGTRVEIHGESMVAAIREFRAAA